LLVAGARLEARCGNARRDREDGVEGQGGRFAALLAIAEQFAGRKVGTLLSVAISTPILLANVLVRDLVRRGASRGSQSLPGPARRARADHGEVSEAGVNVIEINHSRIFTSLPAKDTVIEVECEARDPESIDGA
jgi:threonine dehydratase